MLKHVQGIHRQYYSPAKDHENKNRRSAARSTSWIPSRMLHQSFTTRQLMEKCLESNQSLLCCYIDYEKAFDSVWQEGLWKAMKFFGLSTKYITLLQALYNQSNSAVRVNGELTDWFKTSVGVRQGCVLSPQLFNILLETVMLYAVHDTMIGVRVQGQLINNLRFADDIVLIADNDRDLQTLVDLVHQSSTNFGLKINITKTEIQVISKQPQVLRWCNKPDRIMHRRGTTSHWEGTRSIPVAQQNLDI